MQKAQKQERMKGASTTPSPAPTPTPAAALASSSLSKKVLLTAHITNPSPQLLLAQQDPDFPKTTLSSKDNSSMRELASCPGPESWYWSSATNYEGFITSQVNDQMEKLRIYKKYDAREVPTIALHILRTYDQDDACRVCDLMHTVPVTDSFCFV